MQGGEGVHPMAWKHPNQRVVYVNEARWPAGKLDQINQPHVLVTPPALPMRPGTVTLEMSMQQGLVNPTGKLAPILRGIQVEYAKSPPTNLNETLKVVENGATSAGYHPGSRTQPSATEYLLTNVGGVKTRILANGEIIVIDRAGQVVLHILP